MDRLDVDVSKEPSKLEIHVDDDEETPPPTPKTTEPTPEPVKEEKKEELVNKVGNNSFCVENHEYFILKITMSLK